jgi:hypothetical protein
MPEPEVGAGYVAIRSRQLHQDAQFVQLAADGGRVLVGATKTDWKTATAGSMMRLPLFCCRLQEPQNRMSGLELRNHGSERYCLHGQAAKNSFFSPSRSAGNQFCKICIVLLTLV